MKRISMAWALLVGLVSVLWQVLTYLFRFGELNPHAPFMDYVFFFLSGTIGGLILIFFLNRQSAAKAWWSVLIAFLLGTPLAMLFILGGGMLGYIGILIFPQIPWFIFTWLGSLVGRFLSRGG